MVLLSFLKNDQEQQRSQKNVSDDENNNNDDDIFNIKKNNDNHKNSCTSLNNEWKSSSDSIDDMYHVDIWRVSRSIRVFASIIPLYPNPRSLPQPGTQAPFGW